MVLASWLSKKLGELYTGTMLVESKTKKELREDLEDALAYLSQYVDPYPCRFDHHGSCQEHHDDAGDGRCLNQVAIDFLKRSGVEPFQNG